MLDSRTSIVKQDVAEDTLYSSPEMVGDVGVWIQPSLSDQAICVAESTIIDGIYARTQRPGVAPAIEPDLAWELDAWEAASDEALMFFEAECE